MGSMELRRRRGRRGFSEDRGDEVLETAGRLQVASPAAEIDAGENEFNPAAGAVLADLIDKAADVVEAGGERDAAAVSAGSGDDAEGAAIGAAVLDLEVGAGLLRVGRKGERESSVWAKESSWRILASGTKAGSGDGNFGTAEVEGSPGFFASLRWLSRPRATSATRDLWLLPTTASTSGRAASSSGARWA